MRPSIKPAERLSVTLRYLATGKTFKSLKYSFRISPTLISSIITECCEGLYDTLRSEYLKTPTTEDEWLAIAKALKPYPGTRLTTCILILVNAKNLSLILATSKFLIRLRLMKSACIPVVFEASVLRSPTTYCGMTMSQRPLRRQINVCILFFTSHCLSIP